jgi:uncharacterized membrane protein YhaH (DUF805 family)
MSFQDAVRICLTRKYADFRGRARRSEYWFFILFTVIVSVAGSVLDSVFDIRSASYSTGPIQGILQLALFVPTIAVAARRLHDTGRSGWWQLITVIPVIGWIILIVFLVQDSQPANQHGPNPKTDATEPGETPLPPQY